MPKPQQLLTILVIHNRYQQRGGEDSVFETECAMLEAAGHTVIRYEKHNGEVDRISKLSLFAKTIWNFQTYREVTALTEAARSGSLNQEQRLHLAQLLQQKRSLSVKH